MKCERCEREHDGSYGSGRFCSNYCARGFSTSKARIEINDRLRKAKPVKCCVECGRDFAGRKSQRACSNRCAAQQRMKVPGARERMRAIVVDAIARGNGPQWKSRTNRTPSYPERFWMKVFEQNDVSFIRELKVDRFFIDFAIGNFAVEIDGKQHLHRADLDMRKDEVLRLLGWTVIRIPWKGPKHAKDQIRKLFEKLDVSQR